MLAGCRTLKVGCPESSGPGPRSDYVFDDANFSCQEDPVEPEFDLDAQSFNVVAGLDEDDVRTQFGNMLSHWNDVDADFVLREGDLSITDGALDEADGESEMLLFPAGSPDGDDAIATAFTWPSGSDEASSCDVIFWSVDLDGVAFNYVADGSPSSSEYDLEWIMTHEMGHCLGLGDQIPAIQDTNGVDSMMNGVYDAGTACSAISADDVEALVFLYGAP